MPRGERPLETGDGLLVRFAGDLRQLRKVAGSPTYRQLSGRAHYSAAALSEAAGGRKLPSLAVTLAYVAACEGDIVEWETRWRRTAARLAASKGTKPAPPSAAPEASDDGPAPYVGLVAFQPGDAEWFFGRDALVTELRARLGERRFLGVFGPSGCGKSSVLRAGLVARLNAEHPPASGLCPVVVLTPGRHPLEECAVRLAGLLGHAPADLRAEFAAQPESLHLRIRQALVNHPAEVDLVLVVDQFEEISTLCGEEDERARFIDALVTAATAATSRTRVVLGVRADFYGHCAHYPRLVDALRDAQVMVGPMTADELRQAITQPAEHAGCRVETALTIRIVADAAGQPGVLPLVSHALLETWRRRRGTTLTLTGYQAAGGIHHALAHTAEAVYTRLNTNQQTVARQIFLRLTALGDGTEDTKRRVSRRELDTDNPDTTTVLDQLTTARLITVDHDSVELAHEALIRHWPRLHDWLAADRDGLRIHRDLTDATHAWEAVDRDPGALYRGTRLARAHEWAANRGPALTPQERQFLDASLSARARERAAVTRRTRRLRRLVALLAVLLLLATGAITYAVRAQHAATQQRNIALAQKVLSEVAELRATSPALALQLTLAAYRLDPTTAARSRMHEMLATPYATRLPGHEGEARAVAISPDGKTMATANWSPNSQVRLWDISDPHRPRELPNLPAGTAPVLFSPDGRVLATMGHYTQPQLWDVTDPARPQKIATLEDKVTPAPTSTSMAYSANGHVLAVARENTTVGLWNLADPRHPRPLATLEGGAHSGPNVPPGVSVAFSPDGQTLAATTGDRTTRLWDVTDPAHPAPLATWSGHTDIVLAVAFSPDGRTLATASRDATTRLWNLVDARHPQPVATLTGHTRSVDAVAFSRDGRALATGSGDRTTRLWDVTDPHQPRELATLTGHTEHVQAVAFHADGRTLATASGDQTVRLEDISHLVLASHAQPVYALAFSRDGHTMATAGHDRTIRLWDMTRRHQLRQLGAAQHDDDQRIDMDLSPDGHALATVINGIPHVWDVSDPHTPRKTTDLPITAGKFLFSSDGRIVAQMISGTTILWDIADPHNPRDIGSLPDATATFSPDGRHLAAIQPGGSPRIWDITRPHHPREVVNVAEPAVPLAFSPNGRLLVTAGLYDRMIELWDITNRSGAEKIATIGPENSVLGRQRVAFSHDGQRLVTTGDRIAQLWDISDPRNPREEATLRGHTASVLAVAFSPDGTTIATAGEDHTVRLWEADVERLSARVCEIAHPRLTHTEWNQYFPGLDYQPPCP